MKKFLEILNSKIVIGALVFIFLSLATVLAGNVIVQEGTLNVDNNFNSGGILFVNSTLGNVGIGTTSPSAKLEINSSVSGGTGYLMLLKDTSPNSETNTIYFKSLTGTDRALLGYNSLTGHNFFINSNPNGSFLVYTNGTEKMRVMNSGTVGIRTTNPQSALDVRGITTNPIAPSPIGSPLNSSLFLTHSTAGYGLLFGVVSSGTSWIQSQRIDGTPTTYPLLLNPNGGRVGVGTLAPQRTFVISNNSAEGLEIQAGELNGGNVLLSYNRFAGAYIGNIWYANNHTFTTAGSTIKTLVLTTGGDVGIGTANPSAKLDVNGSAVIRIGGSANKAICWKADGISLGYCSTVIDATGSCTCN